MHSWEGNEITCFSTLSQMVVAVSALLVPAVRQTLSLFPMQAVLSALLLLPLPLPPTPPPTLPPPASNNSCLMLVSGTRFMFSKSIKSILWARLCCGLPNENPRYDLRKAIEQFSQSVILQFHFWHCTLVDEPSIFLWRYCVFYFFIFCFVFVSFDSIAHCGRTMDPFEWMTLAFCVLRWEIRIFSLSFFFCNNFAQSLKPFILLMPLIWN